MLAPSSRPPIALPPLVGEAYGLGPARGDGA